MDNAPAPKPGLFGPKPSSQPSFDPSELREDVNSISSRLRIGEERFSELRKKLSFIEQQTLANQKKVLGEIKLLSGELTEVKRTMGEMQNKIILVIKELQLTARRQDVDVLRKYLDLWEPVKFVTANQVEKIIDEKLADQAGKEESEDG